MSISVVIPCYNSQNTLPIAVKELLNSLESHQYNDYEIILVNDFSKDRTWSTIANICKENKKIKGIDLAKNFGQTCALLAGFSIATGDYVITLEDDCQSSPEHIWEMIDMLNDDYDIVCAKNITNPKRGIVRGIGTRFNKYVLYNLLETPKDISPSIFFVAKKNVIQEMLKYNNPYPYMPGLIMRSTSKIANFDINRRERISGHSGYNLKKLIRLMINGITTFSTKPLKLPVFISCFFIIALLFDIVINIFLCINGHHFSKDNFYITFILLICVCFFVSLSIVADYIGRIYMSINNTPQFIIRDKINLNN